MILINTKTNDAFICTGKEVAKRIGVTPVTISRWKRLGRKLEIFNHWVVYLCPIEIKARRVIREQAILDMGDNGMTDILRDQDYLNDELGI